MKKIRIFALASFLLTVSVAAAAPYGFSHGPYLQELTPTGVTFVFTTSDKGFSWVELRSPEGEITRHYAVKDGLRDAYNTFCTIRTDSLRPATAYDYRLCSKRIDDFQPYRVTFGDSIVSRWYAFRTPDPRSEECSFVALSDMHGDSAQTRPPARLGRRRKRRPDFLCGRHDELLRRRGGSVPRFHRQERRTVRFRAAFRARARQS